MKNVFKLTIGIVFLTLVFSSLGWSQSTADIVLIIDSSGSMAGNDRKDLRKSAAKLFITLAASDVRSDVQIAVVDFDGWAVMLAPLTLANAGNEELSQLESAVDKINSDGSTNIAAGLQQGFDTLSASSTPHIRKAAVLLTDGEDSSYTDEIVSNYAAEGWSIYTIGLGGGINRQKLESIAAATPEGEYYPVDLSKIQEIYNKILAKVTRKSVLSSLRGFLNQDQGVTKNVFIDNNIGQVDFSASWTGSTIEMILVDPSGAEITSDIATALGIGYQVAPTFVIYTVDNPMEGEWDMKIKGTDIPPEGEPYSLVVTGTSDFITNLLAFESSYVVGDTIRIGTRIQEKIGDASQPVLGATTSAKVVRPDGRIETLNLFDDGAHNDNAAGDGVYAENYTNVDILGTYLIRVSAQNGFSREIQQQIIVGDIDNVFVDGSTLIPAAGATLNRAPRSISAVISGPARRIDNESIVLKIDGKVVDHTYDVVNQLVSYQPTRLSRGTHTVSLSVNSTIETDWSFIVQVGVESRFDTLMVLLNGELNLLKETDLAQNYPNPFNPETWIPYQLSQPSDVSIQIYDSSGRLVRTLTVGLKAAGIYRTRSRAAYWDGKNGMGERVASGTYFYTLRTPEFSATRRMVILK